MAELRLAGCRSHPLIGYLKALGVLRVVSRQVDGPVRGRWSAGAFELSSRFEVGELEDFLLSAYEPAPVVSPWNGGSGFFPGDNSVALTTLESSQDTRFEAYRETIHAARRGLEALDLERKPEPKREKPALLRELRRRLPDDAIDWLDAAVILVGTELRFPPLLGSGGNDGRYDFANNYAQAVVATLCTELIGESAPSPRWLRDSIHGTPAPLEKGLSAAHLQRDSSPTNSPLGESDALGNPWDLVLAVEGSLAFAAGAARRHASSTAGALVAPFTAKSTSAGFGSAVAGESGRAELWLPLWDQWTSMSEFETMTREARAQVGRRRARDGLDFARAAGELGVARGVNAFERYAILERAGLSSLAVPAGRIEVRARPSVSALQSIDRWIDRVVSLERGESPARLRAAVGSFQRALFAFAEEGSPASAGRVVELMGELESVLVVSRLPDVGVPVPLRGVSAEPWLKATDDGTDEVAVAASLASLRDVEGDQRLPAVRDYLHGTVPDERGRRDYGESSSFRIPRHAPPLERLAALHTRRHVDAQRTTRAPTFDRGLRCRPSLASRFAEGALNASRIVRLLEGFSLLDFRSVRCPRADARHERVHPLYGVLALAWAGTDERPTSPRPGWAAQLAAGHISEVVDAGLRRLRMAEFSPLLDAEDLSAAPLQGAALSAALLLPVASSDRQSLARLLTREETPTEGAQS